MPTRGSFLPSPVLSFLPPLLSSIWSPTLISILGTGEDEHKKDLRMRKNCIRFCHVTYLVPVVKPRFLFLIINSHLTDSLGSWLKAWVLEWDRPGLAAVLPFITSMPLSKLVCPTAPSFPCLHNGVTGMDTHLTGLLWEQNEIGMLTA